MTCEVVPAKTSLVALERNVIQSMTQGKSQTWKVPYAKDVRLAGHPARRVVLEQTVGKPRAKYVIYILVNGRRAYSVSMMTTAESFDKYEPVFDAVMGSIRRATAPEPEAPRA